MLRSLRFAIGLILAVLCALGDLAVADLTSEHELTFRIEHDGDIVAVERVKLPGDGGCPTHTQLLALPRAKCLAAAPEYRAGGG